MSGSRQAVRCPGFIRLRFRLRAHTDERTITSPPRGELGEPDMEVLTLELRDRKGAVRRALLDQDDAHLLGSYTWSICPKGYVRRKSHGRQVYLHRLILGAPVGQMVDHINGDGLDNRRFNLRLCSHAENARNCQLAKNNRSGFKGVCKASRNRWTAQIRVNGQHVYLGHFDDPRVAAHAYNRAAVELHGEFARLNPL